MTEVAAVSVFRRDAATGEVRIGIFTTRAVASSEELTYDYMFEHYGLSSGLAQGFKCQCGAKNCRCAWLRILLQGSSRQGVGAVGQGRSLLCWRLCGLWGTCCAIEQKPGLPSRRGQDCSVAC